MAGPFRGRHATGGYAFPGVIESPAGGAPGMDLRDYFAAQALVGLLANNSREGKRADFAQDAYAYADAMLKARE